MIHLLQNNPLYVVVLLASTTLLCAVLVYKLARVKFELKRTLAEKDKLFDQYVEQSQIAEELKESVGYLENEERTLSFLNNALLRENNKLIKKAASIAIQKSAFRTLKNQQADLKENQKALVQLYEQPNLTVIRKLLRADIVSEETLIPFKVPGTGQYSQWKVIDLLVLFMKVEAPNNDMVELFAVANQKPQPIVTATPSQSRLSRLQAITEESE